MDVWEMLFCLYLALFSYLSLHNWALHWFMCFHILVYSCEGQDWSVSVIVDLCVKVDFAYMSRWIFGTVTCFRHCISCICQKINNIYTYTYIKIGIPTSIIIRVYAVFLFRFTASANIIHGSQTLTFQKEKNMSGRGSLVSYDYMFQKLSVYTWWHFER